MLIVHCAAMRCRALVLTALAGCVEVPGPRDSCGPGDDRDADGDGWACDAPLADCNDGDPATHPGALEIAGDLIDQDCLGGDVSSDELLPGVSVERTSTLISVTMREHGITLPVRDDTYPYDVSELAPAAPLLFEEAHPERGMGVTIAPWFSTPGTTSSMTIRGSGPALVSAEFTWGASSVGGELVDATGRLTFLPDGRIIRHEQLNLSGSLTAPDLRFGSFVSFVGDWFSSFEGPGDPAPQGLDPDTEAIVLTRPDQDGWVCVFDSATGRRAVLGWVGFGDESSGGRISTGAGRVTLGFDIRGPGDVAEAGLHRRTTVLELRAREAAGCDVDIAQLGLHEASDIDVVFPTEADGGPDGWIPEEGLYGVRSDLGYVEFDLDEDHHAPVFRARFVGEEEHGVTVWLDDRRLVAGVEYLRQFGEDAGSELEVTIAIAGELPDRSRIRIAAPGGEP